MKKLSTLSLIVFTLALASLTNTANAQAVPTPPGPTDATTALTSASDANKILCAGQPISILGPQDAGNVDFTKYHWYKLTDASGTKVETTVTGRSFTETPTTAGYYEYMVVTENSNSCTSPISDVYKVYVLPPLAVTISSPMASLCSGVGTTVLTANVTPTSGYTYTYQWTKGGTPITNANSSTYTVPAETVLVNTTDTYGVTVAYTLNNGCTATATKDILVVPVPTKPSIAFN